VQRGDHQRWLALTMTKIREGGMRFRKLGGAAAGTVMLWSAAATAEVTEVQIINGLQGGPAAVAVDPAALIAEVNANVGKGVASLPNWSQLASLTQLVVDIEFEYNSTAIVPSSYRTLGAIADALHHPLLARYKFLVVGHTDATGGADYNLKLSLARANAITEALGTTFAVSPKRLFAVGVGEELPLDAGNPDAAVNRRVQLVNIGEVR
jgi:outer membrane protein OmpA-like peptidoglycan-associated protein